MRNMIDDMAKMVGSYKRKKFPERIKRSDPNVRKIYAEIIDYDPHNKVKMDNIKVNRHDIFKYLSKRYQPRFCAKICATFCFPNISNFDEYCALIETFIKKDLQTKKLFGFQLYDMNNDGRICPMDCMNNMLILQVDPLHSLPKRNVYSNWDTQYKYL